MATPEMVDRILESAGFKLGPFKLTDLIGQDVNLAVSRSVYDQLNKPERLKPSPLQEKLVEAGKLGRKTGEGFYRY
jgi:3-hydroxybutyryl-CoA dehydrogenase